MVEQQLGDLGADVYGDNFTAFARAVRLRHRMLYANCTRQPQSPPNMTAFLAWVNNVRNMLYAKSVWLWPWLSEAKRCMLDVNEGDDHLLLSVPLPDGGACCG